MSGDRKIVGFLFRRASVAARRSRISLGALIAVVGVLAAEQVVFAEEAWRVQAIPTPAAAHSSVPRVSQGLKGSVLLSWMEPSSNGLAFRYAVWRAGKWAEAQTIAAGPQLLAAVSSEPGVLELVDGVLVAEWLIKSAKEETNEIVVAVSRDRGKTWSKPVVPYRDATAGEHMYVSLFSWPQGGAGVVWLDPRRKKTSSLVQTTIDEWGKLGPETVIADDVCECCPTSSAGTKKGPVVMYRNRTEENVRDMYVSAFSDGRMQAGRPVHADGWRIDGCPTNSGSLAAVGEGVAAIWFTGADRNPRINLAFSQGESFRKPVVIDGAKPIGRAAVAALADGSAMVTWLGHNERGIVLRARQAWPDGRVGKPLDVVTASPNGKLGFPFVATVPGGVMSVWTDWEGERAREVRAALITREAGR